MAQNTYNWRYGKTLLSRKFGIMLYVNSCRFATALRTGISAFESTCSIRREALDANRLHHLGYRKNSGKQED